MNVRGMLVLGLCLLIGAAVQAATTDNFDPPNPNVTANQGNTPPGPLVTAGGPTGQFLRLVNNNVNSQSNHYAYDLTDAGAYSTIVAGFDFRGFGDGNPADGFGVMLLPTATYGATGIGPGGYFAAEEPNVAGVLAAGFDVYPAGGGVNDYSLHYDGVELRNFRVDPAEVDLDANVFHGAHVQVQQMGNGSNVTMQLTRDVNGAPATYTYMEEWVPGLLPYENRLQFSARTGGANMNVDLDNVDIQYSNPYTPPTTIPVGSNQAREDFDSLGTTPSAVTRAGTLPGPLVLGGGPTDNYLRLVNNGVNSQTNAIAFDRIADAGAFGTITADFDFGAAGGASPADGFSLVLLPTAQYGTSGAPFTGYTAEEPNIAGTFGVGFDLYPGMNEVSVHWNGAVIQQNNLPTGDIDLDAGQFHRAHVEITPLANGSNVLVQLTPDVHGTPGTPVTAFNGFVPNFSAYENRVQFMGRTGGLNVDVNLDNIDVQYSGLSTLAVVTPSGLYQDFDSVGGTNYVLTQAVNPPPPGPVLGTDGYAMRLIHDNANSNVNSMGFERAPDGGVSESAIVSFDFRGNDTDPADGFSMMMLPTNNHGRSGAAPTAGEKPNVPNTLAVGFDFYPYWTGTNDVSLHWNGSELVTVNVPGLDLNNGQFHRAEVSMVQVAGGSNVSISIIPDAHGTPGAPIPVVTNHFLAGVFPYDYRAGFAGRTGGANMDIDLDNIASSELPGAAGPTVVQDFEGGGGTSYEGHFFAGGSPPALMTEPGNTFLRLLHRQNDTQNAVSFENNFHEAAATVDAEFSIRIDPYATNTADGGSFVLLNTGAYPNVPNVGAWEEPNLAGTFAIGFDIYSNTSEVSLHWNGAQVANINTITAFGADMRGAGWLDADLQVTYDATGAYVTLTETNNGIPIYTNYFIAGMQPYEAQVVLGARTGGLNTYFDVDNVNVQYTSGGNYIWTNPGTGNYVDGPNWDAGTSPSGADNAFIPIGQANSTDLRLNGTGVVTVEGTGTLNETNTLYLGSFAGGDGRIVQTGGTVNVNGWLASIGHALNAQGRYDMSGGTLTVADYLLVGREGVGHMTIDGAATAVNAQRLFLAEFAGSGGSTLTINDGTLTTTHADGIRVGTYTDASMTQNGGTVDVSNRLHMGHAAGGTGTYNMNGGDLFVREHLVVGFFGTGTFNQAGGTVTQTGGGTYMGDQPDAQGTYNLSGGTLNANFVRLGQWAGSQGTFNLSGTGIVNTTADSMVGEYGQGTLNVDGGTATFGGALWVARLDGSSGHVNQTDGTVNVNGWILALADHVNSTATYDMSGGELNVNGTYFLVGRNGPAHLTQTGGDINANRMFLAEFGTSAGTTYTMSGGTLDVGADFRIAAGQPAEFRVVSGAPTINVNQMLMWSGRSTLAMDVANDGIAPINVATSADLAGHLEMGIHGGVALTENDQFLLIQANPLNSDFSTKYESVFLTGKIGNLYGAMLDPAHGKGVMLTGDRPGSGLRFSTANLGWAQIDDIDPHSDLEVLLDVDMAGGDINDLIAFMTDAGHDVEPLVGFGQFDLLLTVGPHAGTDTSFFMWDFSGLDPSIGLTGLAANVPEPATVTLLALGSLALAGFARRRRAGRA